MLNERISEEVNFKDKNKKGFTLVELLVSTGLVALLLGITLPAIACAKERSRRVLCMSNLKQIGLVEHTYCVGSKREPWYTGIPGGLIYLEKGQDNYSQSLKNIFLCPSDRENNMDKFNNYMINENNSLHASYSNRYMNEHLKGPNAVVFADLNFEAESLDWGVNHGRFGGYRGGKSNQKNCGGNALRRDGSVEWMRKE